MEEILIVCVAAFAAGFIDAVVGGGGLVQTPVLFMTFPQYSVATLLGTTKLPSFFRNSCFVISIFKACDYSMEARVMDCACCILRGYARLVVSHVHQQYSVQAYYSCLLNCCGDLYVFEEKFWPASGERHFVQSGIATGYDQRAVHRVLRWLYWSGNRKLFSACVYQPASLRFYACECAC